MSLHSTIVYNGSSFTIKTSPNDFYSIYTEPDGLPIPSNITIIEVTENTITLAWDELIEAEYYQVMADSKYVISDTNAFTHTGLSENSTHTYKIRLVQGDTFSEWSDEIVVKTNVYSKQNCISHNFAIRSQ